MKKTFFERTKEEQDIIKKAYEFEIEGIINNDSSPNPFIKTLKEWNIWEELEAAVALAYHNI